MEAQLKANQASLGRFDAIACCENFYPEIVRRLRVEYEDRIRQLEVSEPNQDKAHRGLFSSAYDRLAHETLGVERRMLIRLRNERVINDEVLRKIQRDIDLAEARLRQSHN